jgi:4-cresol dehydrogenase (hydroxylating)
MNRVLEIDEECAFAVVEPGVRWFDLYDAIQAGGHRLMLSIADVGWGSVIGNTLDHGVTYMPYGVDMGMQCGMEVALPNGELMRTGMGAMEGNRAWHVYKRGLGPTPDQLFMQSNFGIVTKMGVWLMPYPEVYMPLWLRLRRDDDLAPATDQYAFNDHAYRRFCETIKDALDPNGILAPGKSGIWPKAMRER